MKKLLIFKLALVSVFLGFATQASAAVSADNVAQAVCMGHGSIKMTFEEYLFSIRGTSSNVGRGTEYKFESSSDARQVKCYKLINGNWVKSNQDPDLKLIDDNKNAVISWHGGADYK